MAKKAVKWKGAGKLADLLVPVTSITTHPDNPRKGNLDIIAESLTAHGQLKPIVLNDAPWRVETSGQPVIVAGNHTYLAAVERLGWEMIAAVSDPMEPTRERQFLLIDNRSSDAAEYEQEKLAKLLKDLHDSGALEGSGYTPDDVDDIIAEIDAIARTAPEPFQGRYAESPEELEARKKARRSGEALVEFRLLYSRDEATQFAQYAAVLKKEWGKDLDISEVAFRALREAAGKANQG